MVHLDVLGSGDQEMKFLSLFWLSLNGVFLPLPAEQQMPLSFSLRVLMFWLYGSLIIPDGHRLLGMEFKLWELLK